MAVDNGDPNVPSEASGDDDASITHNDAEVRCEDAESPGEGEGDGDDMYGDADWETVSVCPLTIRFTQGNIHPFFHRRGPIVNVLPKIRCVACPDNEYSVELIPPFDRIHCLRKGDTFWSLDNRRLYALQMAAIEMWPRRCHVQLLCQDQLPRHKFKTHYRKFNTTSEGLAINVRTRYQQFAYWNWFDRAVEFEWYHISRRLGHVLSALEAMPVLLGLLFRTGITPFSSRTPIFVAFLAAFFVDVVRQKVPMFERKLSQLQVVAVLDGNTIRPGLWDGRATVDNGGEEVPPMSAVQLAVILALVCLLLLPYIAGLPDKLQSCVLSCWLGVVCMVAAQLGNSFRNINLTIYTVSSNATPKLTPKHRE